MAAYKNENAHVAKAGSLFVHLCDSNGCKEWGTFGYRAFPCLIESAGFANQLLSDSSYLPMEVGRYVASPFH